MSKIQSLSANELPNAIDEIVRRFGPRAALTAMMLGVLKHRRTKNDAKHLSQRMRLDAGLPVDEPIAGRPPIPPWFPRF